MWRSGRVAAVVAALAVGIIVAEADTVDVTTLSLEASPLGLNPTPPNSRFGRIDDRERRHR